MYESGVCSSAVNLTAKKEMVNMIYLALCILAVFLAVANLVALLLKGRGEMYPQ